MNEYSKKGTNPISCLIPQTLKTSKPQHIRMLLQQQLQMKWVLLPLVFFSFFLFWLLGLGVSEWCGFRTNSHDAIFSGCYPKHYFLVRSILLFSTRLLLVSGDHRWWALIDRGCVFLTQLLCGPRLPELGTFFFFFKRITGHS